MALFDFLSPLLDRIKAALGPLGKLWDKVVEAYNHVTNIITTGNHLVDSIVSEVNAWKNFRENIRFKQRVINLEKAIEKTTELICLTLSILSDVVSAVASTTLSSADKATLRRIMKKVRAIKIAKLKRRK